MTIQSRNPWTHAPERPQDLRRVFCLGDSMMDGAGVFPRETLAAGLERELNETFPGALFETVNFGLCDKNIWHSWLAFRSRFGRGERCDAVIFSLCNNDAELFGDWQLLYEPDKLQYWVNGAPQRPLLESVFEEIAAFGTAQDVVVVILFYQLQDEPCAAEIAGLCAGLGIPFINVARFLSASPPLRRAAMTCSPYDGHPAAAVHRLAARHVAQELRRRNTFRIPTPEASVTDDPDRIVATVGQMIALGYDEARSFDWGLSTLDGKERTARRRLPDTDPRPWLAARRQLDTWLAAWTRSINLGAGFESLRRQFVPLVEGLETLSGLIGTLEELAMALEALRTAEDRTRAGYYAGLLRRKPKPGPHDLYARLSFEAGFAPLPRELAGLGRELRALFARCSGRLPGETPGEAMIERWAASIDGQRRLFVRQETALFDAVHRLEQVCGDIAGWWERQPDREALEQDPDGKDCLTFLCAKLAHAVTTLHSLSAFLNRPLDWPDRPYQSLFSRIDVTVAVETVERTFTEGTQLALMVGAQWPPALPVTETQNVGFATASRVYSFEVPLLVSGTVIAELSDHRATPDIFKAGNPWISRIAVTNLRRAPDEAGCPSAEVVVYSSDQPKERPHGVHRVMMPHLLVR